MQPSVGDWHDIKQARFGMILRNRTARTRNWWGSVKHDVTHNKAMVVGETKS